MAHGLPEYTFEETPLGLGGGGRGGYGGGVGGSSAAGAGAGSGVGAGAGSLIYTTPIFSASSSNSAIGPAPGSAYHQFHHSHSSTTTATSSPASSLYPQTQRSQQHPHCLSQSAPGLKMEPISDDLSAQEAAAREYQPNLEVIPHPLLPNSYCLPVSVAANRGPLSSPPLQGPLVGSKTPSSAITEEYAKADPVYVQKTLVRTSFSRHRVTVLIQVEYLTPDPCTRLCPRNTQTTVRSRAMATVAGGVRRFSCMLLQGRVGLSC